MFNREPHIVVKPKSVYGVTNFYPVCDGAKLFAELAGTKTLTRQSLNIIKRLGYAVELEHEEVGV